MATTDFTNGVTLSDAGWADDVDCSAYSVLTGVAGSTTLTATGPATYTLVSTRPPVWLKPVSTNTGAVTINITPSGGVALGAKNVFRNGAALVGGELRAGVPVGIIYDGTQFNVVGDSMGRVTIGTEQTTSTGASIDFTGIPAGVRRINVMLVGVSTSSSSPVQLQLGESGGIATSGYTCDSVDTGGGPSHSSSNGAFIINAASAANTLHGKFELVLEDASDNTWICEASFAYGNTDRMSLVAGSKALSTTIAQVRLTTAGGTDTFDAGTVNVSYEF